jgi:hypothetical protein
MTTTYLLSELPSNTRLAFSALTQRSMPVRGQSLSAVKWSIDEFMFEPQQLDRYRQCFNFSEDSIPLSFLFVATQRVQLSYLSQKSLSIKLLGLVHVSIEFEQHALLDPSAAYQVEVSLGEQCWSEKGLQFDLVVNFVNEQKIVAGFVSRYIQITNKTSGKPRPRQNEIAQQSSDWTTVKEISFSSRVGRDYASISKDYNPIHLTPWLSKWFGFKRPIVHGMYSVAVILSAQKRQQLCRASFRFTKPILMPNSATLLADGSRWALLLEDDRTAVEAEIITSTS